METEKRLDLVEREAVKDAIGFMNLHFLGHGESKSVLDSINEVPSVNAYTSHEVAVILAEAFGDTCACNFNGNDEWLPEKCELLDACPNTCGVACWEQYLKFRNGERKDNE